MTYAEKERKEDEKNARPGSPQSDFLTERRKPEGNARHARGMRRTVQRARNKETRHFARYRQPDDRIPRAVRPISRTPYISPPRGRGKTRKNGIHGPFSGMYRQATPYPGRLLLHQDTCRRRVMMRIFPLVLRSDRITLRTSFRNNTSVWRYRQK